MTSFQQNTCQCRHAPGMRPTQDLDPQENSLLTIGRVEANLCKRESEHEHLHQTHGAIWSPEALESSVSGSCANFIGGRLFWKRRTTSSKLFTCTWSWSNWGGGGGAGTGVWSVQALQQTTGVTCCWTDGLWRCALAVTVCKSCAQWRNVSFHNFYQSEPSTRVRNICTISKNIDFPPKHGK